MTDKLMSHPWDSPGLKPRTYQDRCNSHRGLCAYDERDPARCPTCHASRESNHCTCTGKVVAAPSGKRTATIRAWAESVGLEVGLKGRIAKSVIDAYEAANP